MDDLIKLNQAFGEAEKKRDAAFFEKHLSDDLVFRRASGKIVGKAQFLAGLQNPGLIYHRISTEIEDVSAANDESSATVKAIVAVEMTNEGKNIAGSFANFRIFKNENGVWKLIAWYNEAVKA
jgi:hypothetical protein